MIHTVRIDVDDTLQADWDYIADKLVHANINQAIRRGQGLRSI